MPFKPRSRRPQQLQEQPVMANLTRACKASIDLAGDCQDLCCTVTWSRCEVVGSANLAAADDTVLLGVHFALLGLCLC